MRILIIAEASPAEIGDLSENKNATMISLEDRFIDLVEIIYDLDSDYNKFEELAELISQNYA